jgi:hypothetical protein
VFTTVTLSIMPWYHCHDSYINKNEQNDIKNNDETIVTEQIKIRVYMYVFMYVSVGSL